MEAWHASSLQESRSPKWHNDSVLQMTSGNVISLPYLPHTHTHPAGSPRIYSSALIKNNNATDRMQHECSHLNEGISFQDSRTHLASAELPTVSRALTRSRDKFFLTLSLVSVVPWLQALEASEADADAVNLFFLVLFFYRKHMWVMATCLLYISPPKKFNKS